MAMAIFIHGSYMYVVGASHDLVHASVASAMLLATCSYIVTNVIGRLRHASLLLHVTLATS